MKGLSALFLLTAFGLGAAATAQPKPAWMLIWVYETGMLTREFPSMDECESIADHISKVRPLEARPRESQELGNSILSARGWPPDRNQEL